MKLAALRSQVKMDYNIGQKQFSALLMECLINISKFEISFRPFNICYAKIQTEK